MALRIGILGAAKIAPNAVINPARDNPDFVISAVGARDPERAKAYAAEHKIPWPILFDPGQVMMSYLKVTPANPKVNFPHLFIIDGTGTIRYDFEGAVDAATLSADIDKLLK